ncbi:hypothetical protein BH23ACT4_BH23ACT4_14570 [soil metagenome]
MPASSGVQRADLDESAPFAELAAGFNDAGFDFGCSQCVAVTDHRGT